MLAVPGGVRQRAVERGQLHVVERGIAHAVQAGDLRVGQRQVELPGPQQLVELAQPLAETMDPAFDGAQLLGARRRLSVSPR